jgi:hypothetical protein
MRDEFGKLVEAENREADRISNRDAKIGKIPSVIFKPSQEAAQ